MTTNHKQTLTSNDTRNNTRGSVNISSNSDNSPQRRSGKLHTLNAKSKELPERKYTFRETHNGEKKSIKHDPVTVTNAWIITATIFD